MQRVIRADSRSIPLADGCADMIVTSPPYRGQRDYGSGAGEIGLEDTTEEWQWSLIEVAEECVRALKPGGVQVWNIGHWYQSGSISLEPYAFAQKMMDHCRLRLLHIVSWGKLNPTPTIHATERLTKAWEPCFVFVQGKPQTYHRNAWDGEEDTQNSPREVTSRKGGGYRRQVLSSTCLTADEKRRALIAIGSAVCEIREGTLIDFRMKIRGGHAPSYGGKGGRPKAVERDGFSLIRISGARMARDWFTSALRVERGAGFHSAVFPRELASRFIRTYSSPGDLIVDPFSGAGTTGVAAKALSRRYAGLELNGRYCDDSQSRIDGAPTTGAHDHVRRDAPDASSQGRLF